jgi:putative endonuclease
MTTGYQTGLRAEKLAALYLRCKGYRILGRRYKTPVGEIDLIARRGRIVVFVEVKARKTLEDSAHAIQPQQIGRMRRAAEHYMMMCGDSGMACRFDAIFVAKPWQMRHLCNIA